MRVYYGTSLVEGFPVSRSQQTPTTRAQLLSIDDRRGEAFDRLLRKRLPGVQSAYPCVDTVYIDMLSSEQTSCV